MFSAIGGCYCKNNDTYKKSAVAVDCITAVALLVILALGFCGILPLTPTINYCLLPIAGFQAFILMAVCCNVVVAIHNECQKRKSD